MPEILDEASGPLLDEGAGFILDETAAAVTAAVTGGWWQLHSIIEQAKQEREFWDSQPAMACPRCGEPLRPAPPSDSGAGVESYCQFDGWRYPEDWDASTMSGM